MSLQLDYLNGKIFKSSLGADYVPPQINAKILLVEDDPIIQYVNQNFLESLGCKVKIATTGKQTLRIFQNYDLVLLDIGLPDIDGIKVCQKIRYQDQKNHTHTLMIALTAFSDVIEQECRDAGVDDFAVKPLSLTELYSLLSNWLPDKRTT